MITHIINTTLHSQMDKSDFQLTTIAEVFIFVFCFAQSGLQVILALRDLKRESEAAMEASYGMRDFEAEFLKKTGTFTEAFSKHLYNEHGYESYGFLSAVYDWEKTYFDVSPKTARSRARKICNTYVGDNAELPCNLSYDCVIAMQRTLEKSDADIPYDFFVVAKGEIINMLYQDSFRRFILTSEFKRLAKMNRELTSSPMIESYSSLSQSPKI